MQHVRSSVDGVFILENNGIPTDLITNFGEPIKRGSMCVDTSNDDLYILKNNIGWVLVGGGGGTNGNVLGPARDGSYDDGLFPFTPLTPTGFAVDDINQLLVALVPASAPDLSDWTGSLSGDVSGKLSFDTANPIVNYTPADGVGISNPISVDGSWSISGKRLGIHNVSGTINGVLNNQVLVDDNDAYDAKTFGKANIGVLNLILNNVLIDTIDLTSTNNAISSSNISVGLGKPSRFPSGAEFTEFINRTGTWSLSITHPNTSLGYNSVILEHDQGSNQIVLDRYEFVIDDNVTPTSFSGESLNNISLSGIKYLSGIGYYTGGTAKYDINIDNLYRNTYYQGSDAISHNGNSNTYGTLLSSSNETLTPCGGDELKQLVISQKNCIITNSNIRLIDESISLNTTAKRTVQSNLSTTINSVNNTINNILLDNVAASSTDYVENFNDENKRLISSLSYDNITDITLSGTWSSQNWLLTSGVSGSMVGYEDGLQVIGGKLIYPVTDFNTTNIPNASSFNDGGVMGGIRNYSNATGDRSYIRYFRQVSPTTANFIINVSGMGGTFVSKSTILTGNNIHLEIKCPTETGWLDCYNDFVTNGFNDGDGSRSATDGAGRAFNTDWGLTIGTRNTALSSGYMVVKITVPQTFTGEISNIDFTFN